MNSAATDRLREMQLLCIGKLMAGLSHEFKNHLAIIKESSGLIQDLLMLEDSELPPNTDRFQKIIEGINDRIAQAAEMCRYLSGFAHRMDQPLSSFSVTEVLEEEIYLLSRFARQQQVKLLINYGEDLPLLYNNPSLLQFIIFCLIWPRLEQQEPGSSIAITVSCQNNNVQLLLESPGADKSAAPDSVWSEMISKASRLLLAEYETHGGDVILKISSTENIPPSDDD